VLDRLTRRLFTAPSALSIATQLALGSAAVSPARAEPPSTEAAADARLNQAKQKFDEGVRAFGERRYAEAAQAFREADAIQPSPALSFNIARAYERLEDAPGALRWYRDYLRRNPQATNAAEVRARIAQLTLVLEARGVQQLSVLGKPAGAEVSIDGRAAGVVPFTTELSPGAHHLSARASGYGDQELDFVLEPRSPQDLVISLEPLAPSQPLAPPAKAAPPAAPPPPPALGKRPFGIAPWIVLGAGAASSLGALGFELARRSAESDAKQADQLDYPQHFDAMHGRQTTARILAVAGGALLLGGGALLLLNTPQQPTRSLALGCTSSGCALGMSGSFE
jgi:tetratricopeptide (TPR) repeat protein